MPLYKVTDSQSDEIRLVVAENQTRALKHVVEDRFKVSLPDGEEVADLVAEGVAKEKAVPPAPRQPQQQLQIPDPNASVPTSFDPGE